MSLRITLTTFVLILSTVLLLGQNTSQDSKKEEIFQTAWKFHSSDQVNQHRLFQPGFKSAFKSSATHMADSEFYLVNSANPKKRVRLKSWMYIEFYLKDKKEDPAIDYQDITITGYIEEMNGDDLTLELNSEWIYTGYKNDNISNIEHTYLASEDKTFKKYSLQDIDYVVYTKPSADNMQLVGGILTTLSSLTTLIVAPLVSINYREGGFNSDRYFLWAGSGLAGLVVGIPLIALNDGRKFRITTNKRKNEKGYWYFSKE